MQSPEVTTQKEAEPRLEGGTIEVSNVSKNFGKVPVLNKLSVSVRQGEIFSVIRPSGCGKTTLLRCVAGLEVIDDGEILLGGVVVSSPKKKIAVTTEDRKVGLVFQSYALWPHMTVHDNVAFGLTARSASKAVIEEKVQTYLKLVGLSDYGKRYPFELSGGQQQRVALARSFAYEPKVLLLDEPLSNLDFKERVRMRGELRFLLKRIGITTLYVTHDQEEAFAISDRIAILHSGRLIQEGGPREIYERPNNRFVADFVGWTNLFEATLVKAEGDVMTAHVEDLGADLTFPSDPRLSKLGTEFLIMIRPNEVQIHGHKHGADTNMLEGELTSEQYRGVSTDYTFKVGSTVMRISGHRFCTIFAGDASSHAYIHIRPESITIVPRDQ